MLRRLRSKMSYANVASTLALVLALSSGVAYAANTIYSTDIVDGEVKTSDIHAGAVTSGKLRNGVVSTEKIADGTIGGTDVGDGALSGTDIDQTTLLQTIRLGYAETTDSVDLPDCNPGIDYLVKSITVPHAGYVLVTGSFTAGWPYAVAGPYAIAARIERTDPTVLIGHWQEDHLPPDGAGRGNIAVTQVFPVAQGTNTFSLKVCDQSDAVGWSSTVDGQMTFVYTTEPLI